MFAGSSWEALLPVLGVWAEQREGEKSGVHGLQTAPVALFCCARGLWDLCYGHFSDLLLIRLCGKVDTEEPLPYGRLYG